MLSEAQAKIALPIKGKKRKLNPEILIDYFGRFWLGLNRKIISLVLDDLDGSASEWDHIIGLSFLPGEMKSEHRLLLAMRRKGLLG